MNNILKMIRSCGHFSILCFILRGTSCDAREASEILEEEGMTLTILTAQPVADGAAVGEAIVNRAGILLIAELRDADGEPVKSKVISFSSDYSNGDFTGIFEENMMVCIESYVGEVGGKEGVKLEDQYVVTNNGLKLMSKVPLNLI